MSQDNLKTEIAVFLRNNDVMTITDRQVTTDTIEDTIDATEYIINKSNVKNIRKVEIDTDTLNFGKDYKVNYNHGPENDCKLTFTINQTGNIKITYDYGADRIFTDRPRDDLKINSYPRISVEEISKSTNPLSLYGQDFISERIFQITVFAENQDYIETVIEKIEQLFRTNAKKMYHSKWVYPTSKGNLQKSPNRSDTILSKNVDLLSQFEIN